MRENDIVFFNLHRKYLNEVPDYGGFLGIYALAAFVNDNGYRGQAFAGSLQEGKRIIDELCTQGMVQMIGLYCDYANVTENIYISSYVKNKYHLPVIVGGPQATALREDFFVRSQCDAAARYEGELTAIELLDCLLDGTGSLDSIRGISYLRDGCLAVNPERPLIGNLDALPFIDDDCYLLGRPRRRELSIMTGRGCPFHCAFCHEGEHTRRVRWRSVANVLAEIDKYLEEHPWPEEFYLLFVDDTLTLDENRLRELCEGVRERREKRGFQWFCEGHVHTLAKHPDMIKMLADAGLHRLQLGIESGCSEVLQAYHKQTTPEEIKEVVALCRDAGIQQIYGNIILGSAFFSEDTYRRDLAFAQELQALGEGTLELGVISYWPLPETEITSYPDRFGLSVADYDFYTSADDFAQTTAPGFGVWDIMAKVQAMDRELSQQRGEMLLDGRVPFPRIVSWCAGHSAFRAYGLWYQELMHHPHLLACCQMIAAGEAVRGLDEFAVWQQAHPMRVLALSKHLEIQEDGTGLMAGVRLERAEMEVLALCTGRLNCRDVLAHLVIQSPNITLERLRQILLKFEQNHLIVYSREEN